LKGRGFQPRRCGTERKPGFSRWGEPLEPSCGTEKGVRYAQPQGLKPPSSSNATAARLKAAPFQSRLNE